MEFARQEPGAGESQEEGNQCARHSMKGQTPVLGTACRAYHGGVLGPVP